MCVCLESVPLVDGLELVPAVERLHVAEDTLQKVSVLLERLVAFPQLSRRRCQQFHLHTR